MAKDPAFLFYPNDFLSGTQFFSDEQVGKFMRILMAQHQHGHLTEDQVIFICKSYDKHIFSKLKQDSTGLWYNERLQIEIEKSKNYVLSRSKNKEGKTKEKIISKTHDLHVVNEDENVNRNVFEDNYKRAFDEIYLDQLAMKFKGIDLAKELTDFRFKCDSAPTEYHCRDRDGLRLGLLAQLKKPNGQGNGKGNNQIKWPV
jgi:hypothetical protein